jgi:sialidase-1
MNEMEKVRVRTRRPVVPVLTRNDRSPLLRLTIEVNGTETETVRSATFSFRGTDDLGDLESVGLAAGGGGDEPLPGEPIGSVHPVAETMVLPLDRRLPPGRHVFWLTGKLRPTASLRHRITASCTSLETATEKLRPQDESAHPFQRIGIALRRHNDDGVHTHRIPALTRTPRGTLICAYDLRRRMSRDLQEDIDIGLSRSTDGGQSWEAPRVIMDMGSFRGLPPEQNGCSDPGLIVDPETGEIFCFAVWMWGKPGKHQWNDDGSEPGFEIGKSAQLLLVRSRDDGRTWSRPENLTRTLKREAWWLLAPAPQSGICLADGTLVMPMQGRDEQGVPFATIMSSRDHGKSWKVGTSAFSGGNECQAVELGDGSVMLNMRNDHERFRAVCITADLGLTWSAHPTHRNTLIEPNCNGSILRVDYRDGAGARRVLLFANPHSQTARTHQTLRISSDEGLTWPARTRLLLDEGKGRGYPSLTRVDEEHIGIVYEGSQADLVFERISLRELGLLP